MKIKICVALLVAIALPLRPAATFDPIYNASKTTVLSGGTEVITIQNPNNKGVKMSVRGVYVKCSVPCDFTLERDGTAATTTALAFDRGSKASPAPVGVAFSASNAGTGVFKWPYTSGPSGLSVPLTGVDLPGDGSNSNFSVRIAALTGTVFVLTQWGESD